MIQIPKVITNREEVQTKISNAAEALYKVAKAAYGPKAGNVILGFKHGAPLLSRDGVTNIREVRLQDPFEDDFAQAIKQVSEQNNQKVGDGTTAVVILSYFLYLAARKFEASGYNPMEIVTKLKEAEEIALSYVNSIKKSVDNDELLEYIATVSAGDASIGAMIADVMKEVSKDGGVIIERYEGVGIHNEIIDGFYFGRGFKDAALINNPSEYQSNHTDIPVLVSNKVFNTEVDIAPVLSEIVKAGYKELLIIGEVNNAALETLKMTRAKSLLLAVSVDPPFAVGGRILFLDDVALLTGATVYEGVEFNPETHLGFAKEVMVNSYSTTIMGGDADKESVKERIKLIRQQLKEETQPQSIQFAKERLARLTGKMAVIKVGGAIEFEREETMLRVQDSVSAVQSALKDGILPGGAVSLARVSGTAFDDAFRKPFEELMENAGLNPNQYLANLTKDDWKGFNLRNLTDKPVDMLKEGIIDPSLVVSSTITNAVSIVSGLISANAAISYQDKE